MNVALYAEEAITMRRHPNQRRHPRLPTSWPARVELGSSVVIGTIRDASPGGLCMEPECGYLDGKFVAGRDLLEEFLSGDEIEVCLVRAESGRAERVRCEVRWSGLSQAHSCSAIGLERLGMS